MELLPQADSIIRQLVPGMLDVAGFGELAQQFRHLETLSSLCNLVVACEYLQEVRDLNLCSRSPGRIGTPSDLRDMIQEVAFWAEAALWAAFRSDPEMYTLCDARVRSELDIGFSSMSLQ